jgi:hypothetical protein
MRKISYRCKGSGKPHYLLGHIGRPCPKCGYINTTPALGYHTSWKEYKETS